MEDEIVKKIIKQYWRKLRKKKYVIGYSGTLKPRIRKNQIIKREKCFRIYVTEKIKIKDLSDKDILPSKLRLENNEVPIDVVQIGEIVSLEQNYLQNNLNTRKKFRPVIAGVSGTHYKSGACTLNVFFRDKKTGRITISGNEHCLGLENVAHIGDPILQPSPLDGGKIEDKIGVLYKHVPIKFNDYNCRYRNLIHKFIQIFKREKVNKVDIAFSTLDYEPYKIEALGIGKIKGKRIPKLNEEVMKIGRTTGLTFGTVIDLDWYGKVKYSRGTALFGDCILIKILARPGDSGSPVFDLDHNYLACLFGGSEEYATSCKVDNIEEIANMELLLSV